MTKSTITDERITSVIERLEHYACNLKWTNVRGAQDLLAAADGLRELQERRKAAMDSEPVAWTWHYREQWHVTNDERRAEFVAKDGDVAVLPLYRHVQPAPVVLKSIGVREAISALESAGAVTTIGQAYKMGWNACRAAMLERQLVDRVDEELLNTIKAPTALGSLPKTGEVQNTNSPENPGCWCRTCRPVVLNDMRFVVCPDCGNKRCPRANDHRNACTGSNEPGQEGSAYPAAPQSPGSEPATVPGKWIPVSERMPPIRHEVLVGRWWGEKPRWCCKWATYIPGHPDAQSSGWLLPGASWTPTHWMPLPAGPQEVKGE